MNLDRRGFLKLALTASAFASMRRRLTAEESGTQLFRLEDVSTSRVKIASIELMRSGNLHFVRASSMNSVVGIAITSSRVRYLYPILQQLVIPYFVGKDARHLESLVDGVYVHNNNYKLAGIAFWCCVAWVEFSLLDLLGKVAGRSVGELLGGVIRREIPVYLSSMRRDTTPEQEVAWVSRRLDETGAKAAKVKVGGRMSNNADAFPGRTDRLILLARKTFGDAITIHADANGSYDARKGIEVGKMLEAYNAHFFEEPCPFEELEETKRVADALSLPVAGGEQDASLPRFRRMIRSRVVDVVQPDLHYNGGFIRTARVARMAAAAGMPITVHSSEYGIGSAYMLQFASCTPNIGKYQEYKADPHEVETWYAPSLEVKNGVVKVPTGHGLGITLDPEIIRKAKPV